MNRNAVTTLAVAVALAVGAGAAVAQDRGSMTERDVQDMLAKEGYTNIRDVEFDDGMWEAEARRSDGRDLDLRIDPRTGAIHPEDAGTNLSAEDIEASLTAAGYSRIHDVDFDDGLWRAEAYDSSETEWELYLDARTGEVVGRERD